MVFLENRQKSELQRTINFKITTVLYTTIIGDRNENPLKIKNNLNA